MENKKTTPSQAANSGKQANLTAKLYAIMAALDFIAKDKTNDFHRYRYASEQAIKEAVHAQLVEKRVLFNLNFKELVKAEGNLIYVVFDYTFTNVDDANDQLKGTFIGSGEDKGDKAVYKAITGAIKYILTSTFLIPTGDDPEANSQATGNSKPVQKPVEVVYKDKAKARTPKLSQEQPAPAKAKGDLDEKTLRICIQRIEDGDAEVYDKVYNYYNVSEEQRAKLVNARLNLETKLQKEANAQEVKA
jgi:hypothetical protein